LTVDRCRRINRRICYSTAFGRQINFGEATPWNKCSCENGDSLMEILCFDVLHDLVFRLVRTYSLIVTMIIVMAFFFYKFVVLPHNARFDLNSTWLDVPESVYLTNFQIDPCACSNDVIEKNFGGQIDMSLFGFSGKNETNHFIRIVIYLFRCRFN